MRPKKTYASRFPLARRVPVADRDDPIQRRGYGAGSDDFSLAQIARAGVMLFGFVITLTGIVLIILLFNSVHGLIFNDAGGLEEIFEKWQDIIIPDGADPTQYDETFPVSSTLTLIALAFPVLFLGRLATKVLTIGIKIATIKDPNRD
jgi:hypothetical protein